ncbi:hypothetical protein SAMN05428997_13217 [Bosea sp. CRIB-10]|nr:hypothetical protein SAMN05428997_13217 [Bosea sp. CRIB-10]
MVLQCGTVNQHFLGELAEGLLPPRQLTLLDRQQGLRDKLAATAIRRQLAGVTIQAQRLGHSDQTVPALARTRVPIAAPAMIRNAVVAMIRGSK